MIWTPPAPLSSWCGVQNRGLSGSGRHCHVCVASKIWDGVEVDASVKSVWRPESGMEWKWTPLSCLRGVQNWEWSGNGRHCHVDVASKIGDEAESDATAMFVWRPESGMEWKWTPLPCLCGVQNLGYSRSGRHCPPPGVLRQDSCNSGRLFIRSGHFSTNSGRLLISSQCILTGVQL